MEPTTRIELVTSSLPRTRSYQLSYVGPNLERETGIEPATNSLEGCDSTTELLPPSRSPTSPFALRRVNPPSRVLLGNCRTGPPARCRFLRTSLPNRSVNPRRLACPP